MFTEAETQLLYEAQKKKLETRELVCDGSVAYDLLTISRYRASLSRLKTYVDGIMDIIQEMAISFTIPGPLAEHLEKISYVVIGLSQVDIAFVCFAS
jgi:hypothetical protein